MGDLTSTLFQSPANASVPKLPATSVLMPLTGTCAEVSQDTESGGAAPSVPTKQTMPTQGGGSQPASYYYPERDRARERDPRRSPHHDRDRRLGPRDHEVCLQPTHQGLAR